MFNVGSPFRDTTFAVVRITEQHLQVASWNWIERRWGPRFRKALAPEPAVTLPARADAGRRTARCPRPCTSGPPAR
jgi:hypothetical protein